MPSEPWSEFFSSVSADVFSGGASAVATAALSPLPAASLLRELRVRGVRCDISVLLNAGRPYAPPFYAFACAANSRASFWIMKTSVDEFGNEQLSAQATKSRGRV
jgi:hypothetical protein